MSQRKPQLIVALDVDTACEAKALIDRLSPVVEIFKVGSQIFVAAGTEIVQYLNERNKGIFLDLKFHDIPNTVANAAAAAVRTIGRPKGVSMYSVHTQGGLKMLAAAAAAAVHQSKELKILKPLGLGITVLTSEMKTDNIHQLVLERAHLAKKAGLDGVVASVAEAFLLRREFGQDFIIVTPGIRPEGESAQDQQRIATPAQAVQDGSDYLVVGRPIVKAKDPLSSAKKILKEIQSRPSS